MEKAIKQLRVALVFAEDGAPADAMRCAIEAVKLLSEVVFIRYLGWKPNKKS